MFTADTITFQEFMKREPLPLATIQGAVMEFLQGRDDVVLFGAQAVNAYVKEPRMSEDVDVLSVRAGDLAVELRDWLSQRFHIAIRVRTIREGRGYRLFHVRKGGNRHLADVRSVSTLPHSKRIARVNVMAPPELIAAKVLAYHHRRRQPKAGTDWRDLAMLLLAFPDLKRATGPVATALRAMGAEAAVLGGWRKIVETGIHPGNEDEEF